jgi:hypothetical protein
VRHIGLVDEALARLDRSRRAIAERRLELAFDDVFFFWPPVHWVTRKMHEARELACDERAIERGAFAAPEYAEHLLDVLARTRGHAAYEALAIGRTAQRLERRIDRLLERARSRRPSARHAAVLLALLLAALVGFRPEHPSQCSATAQSWLRRLRTTPATTEAPRCSVVLDRPALHASARTTTFQTRRQYARLLAQRRRRTQRC